MASSRSSPSDLTFRLPPGEAVCVGFSGGVDSVVLLDALATEGVRPVTAVHVHHGLSPNADAWADFCRDFCAQRKVPLTVQRVQVDRAAPEGLEAAARKLRYAIYAARPERFVALAHHLDDQAETVLLQLLRGTGLKGVAAMPELRALPGSSVQVYRPLLGVSRAQILQRANERGLRWVDDESNASGKHDRNYLRHEIAPLLDARFPQWRAAAARFARHAAESGDLLDALAQMDGLPPEARAPLVLNHTQGTQRRVNLVRAWLARAGIPSPSEGKLVEIARQAVEAASDRRVEILVEGHRVVRHDGALYLDVLPPEPLDHAWRGERHVDLGARGEVDFRECEGNGVAVERITDDGWRFVHRSGGEKIRIASHGSTIEVKKLLQDRGVPWWWRQKMPLLFHRDRLVWVPGLLVALEYRAEPGETGLEPVWRLAGKPLLC